MIYLFMIVIVQTSKPDAVDVDAKLEKWEGLVALLECCGSEISTFAAVS